MGKDKNAHTHRTEVENVSTDSVLVITSSGVKHLRVPKSTFDGPVMLLGKYTDEGTMPVPCIIP